MLTRQNDSYLKTLCHQQRKKSQPLADINEIAPPVKSIEASLIPSPSSDKLATILDTVQKLAKRMDCLENRENVRQGAMGGKRKANLQLDNNKRHKPSCSTAMDVDTENPSPDYTVQTDCQRQGDSEGGEDIFHDMAASFDSDEDWGPLVSDRLAELLELRFGSKLPDRKIKEKLTAHRILANCCKSMEVPKTNQEVFSVIPPSARKADVRMRNTQLSFTKAAVAITCCIDRLLKLSDSLSTLDITKPTPDTTAQLKQKTTECIANLADALALTGHACKDLFQKRRDMHRPHFPPESVGICALHVPMSSEWLYPKGSEFHKSLKEVRETCRPGQDLRDQASRRPVARPVAPRKFKRWHFFRLPTLAATATGDPGPRARGVQVTKGSTKPDTRNAGLSQQSRKPSEWHGKLHTCSGNILTSKA